MLTAVVDRGIGIPADEIPKLFERFHRARNVSSRYYGGLGLGLYIAKAIVEAHNGSISGGSEEGQRATFTIIPPLPLTARLMRYSPPPITLPSLPPPPPTTPIAPHTPSLKIR